jgi:hypothetical protein
VSNIEEYQFGELRPTVGKSIPLGAHVALNVDFRTKGTSGWIQSD